MATFNGQKQEEYFLARDVLGNVFFYLIRYKIKLTSDIYLEPPAELLAKVFPWVEQKQAELLVRVQDNPLANDMALKQFLQLLLWLRRVLIQDAAVLFSHDSTYSIFQHSIFKTAAFHRFAVAFNLCLLRLKAFYRFAATSQPIIAEAEEKARLALKNLPDTLVRTLRGILADTKIQQEQDREEHRQQLTAIYKQFGQVERFMEKLAGSKGHGLKSGKFNQLYL